MSTNPNPDLANIQSLESEFQSAIDEYNQSYNTYIEAINTEVDNVTFEQIPSKVFLGTSGIRSEELENADECEVKCASNDRCTGATYNTSTKHCWLRSGSGPLSPDNNTFVAIVPNTYEMIQELRRLNTQVIDIHDNLHNAYNNYYSNYDEINNDIVTRRQELSNYKTRIDKETQNIDNLENKYQTLNKINTDGGLYTTSMNMWLILWTIVVIGLVILLIYQSQHVTIYANTTNVSIYIIVLVFVIIGIILLSNKLKLF